MAYGSLAQPVRTSELDTSRGPNNNCKNFNTTARVRCVHAAGLCVSSAHKHTKCNAIAQAISEDANYKSDSTFKKKPRSPNNFKMAGFCSSVVGHAEDPSLPAVLTNLGHLE